MEDGAMTVDTAPVQDTLARSLRPAAVDFSQLDKEAGPMLRIVRLLIGVVPNCDPVLAIWPPGFVTYNLLVPNLLNLPFSVLGFGPPAVTLGLALTAASWTARCSYCTAHTCSFALRRGAPPEKLAGVQSPAEKAAVAAAEALASIPSTFTAEHRNELLRFFSAQNAERLVLGVSLMGFLNKFMDALGIDLEETTVNEVSEALRSTGWTTGKHRVAAERPEEPALQPRPGGPDTLATRLALLRQVPGAIRLEKTWIRGVPSRWPAVGTYLKEQTGHEFPVLSKVRSRRAVRAIATALRDNLSTSTSRLGLPLKALSGLVYASIVGNETLAREARLLAARTSPSVDEKTLDAVARFAADPADTLPALGDLGGLGDQAAAALLLAKAISPSPAAVPGPLIEKVSTALTPQAQVELVVWISVQQMLHRLGCYVDA
jgi:alkylhydroperoxidase family enzyme